MIYGVQYVTVEDGAFNEEIEFDYQKYYVNVLAKIKMKGEDLCLQKVHGKEL